MAVAIPATVIPLRKFATVLVEMLSVEATPVSPEPSPENVVAVITPTLRFGVPLSPAAVPVVFWLPASFTPGRLILAEPLKETPPMFLAVSRAVAVAAFPEVSWLPDALTPGRLIPAEPSKDTPPIVLAVARMVAVPALPETLPVTSPVRSPTIPPVAVVTPAILTPLRNSASVAVWMLSVEATPVSPEPSPMNEVASIDLLATNLVPV